MKHLNTFIVDYFSILCHIKFCTNKKEMSVKKNDDDVVESLSHF